MLRAILGKSSERSETSTSQTSRRKDEVDRPASRHRSESIVSSNSARKPPQGDDRDRGFNPNSTSYSSTSRTAYPGTASASVASSYATASSNQADQPFIPPGLVRNASLADQMPKPKSGRDDQWRESGRERRVERRRERSTSRERQRDYKERSRSRDREGKKRSKKEKRENRESDRGMDRGISRSGDSYTGDQGTVRAGDYSAQASGSFNAQVGSSGFTQFPGQYDGGMPAFAPGPLPSAANMSSYVPDQFPGQFPSQSTAPYRPPVAATEGGPGLAAEYYGDAGESVAHQPGVRPQAPSLIVGAEPHLQAASLISAPPVEPSVTGNVGAAASFFSGTDNYQSLSSIKPPKPGKQSKPEKPSKANKISGSAVVAGSAALGYATANSGSSSVNQGTGGSHSTSFYQQGSNVPAPSAAGYSPSTATQGNSHHSSSAPVIPTLGAAAAGAAAGYMMGHHSSSQYSRPSNVPSMAGGVSGYAASSSQRPESQTHTAYVSASSNGQPTKPGKHSSQSNVPLYAAGVAGTAGAVAAAYQSHHHSTAQNSFSGSYPSGSIAQRHRHRGPLSKLVDFWKDPDGVAEFEEYTEYIGVCKYCFPPGSSPRDAPRKHHYRRRGSNERYGSSTRIDKESRYWSSDGESRRKNGKSWLATGMAGYGLAKVGQSLFNQKGNFDGTYSVRSGRANNSNWSLPGRTSQYSPDRRSYISRGATHRSFDTTSRRRSRSRDRVETGITSDGKVYKKDPHGGFLGGPATTTYRTRRRRSRSRSWSRDRRSGLAGAALGAAIGSSMATSTVRHRSRSPKKEFIRTRRRSREQSPSLGFMLGNGGSRNSGNGRHTPSSSYVDIPRSHRKSSSGVFGGFFSSPSEKRRRSRERKQKGFFNFGNSSSSSSSDADLAFGTGIERSRSHRQPKTKWNDRRNTNAGILGLGAAAAALAANEHSKGRQHSRRPDLVAVKEPRSKHGKPSERSHKSKMSSSSSSSEDGGWEDASEDDDSSTVSSGLAYGGPARKSQDSLLSEASGTGKWGWRWGSKKKKKDPIYPLNTAGNGIPLAGAAAVGLAGGVIGAALTSEDRRDGAASSVSSLPSMQHVYPTPTLDPSRFDISRQSSVIASNLPLMTSRPGPIPLQQPQPIAPVPPAVYATQAAYGHSYSAPNGPPVFSQVPLQPQPTVQQARIVESPKMVIPGSFVSPEIGNERLPKEASKEKSHHRRASSPTPRISDTEPSSTSGRKRASTRDQGSGLRFDTSKAQADKEHRDRRRQKEEDDKIRQQSRLREEKERADQEQRDKRRRKDEDDTRRESARLQEAHERAEEERREKRRRKDEENIRRERAQLQEAHERAEEERREKRRKLEEEQFHRERLRLREAEEQAQNDMERRRRSDKPREKVDGRARSEKDLDKETQRLRDQEREPEDSTTSESWVAPVVIGAMGAVVGASIADGATSSTEKRQGMRREERSDSRDGSKISNADDKSSRQRMFSQESDRNADPQGQTVRKVAAKAASSSRHEDYAAYFTPIELLSKSGEQRQAFDINSDNEFTSHQTPHIITIEPTSRKGPLYSPACALKATKDGQDPNRVSLPWSVPRLNLIEPTPPHSTAGSTKGDASPIMRPEDATAADVTEPEKPSTASKVTWGEPETMEYTVITPLESHEEFISYPSMPRSPEEEIAGSRPPTIAHDREERSPIVDASPGHIPGEFGDDLEFAATLAAGLQDTGFDPSIVIDDPTYRRRESPPGSERTVFYERPFAETVTDLGLQFPGTEGAPPQRGFIEGELPSTPKDEQILIGPEGFVDEPEIKLRKNDKKKRDKAAKRQVRDNPSTTASSKSISSSKDEELEEPDRHSREPEPMVSIPSNSFNDLDELADLKKPKSKKSKKDDGRFATTSPGSPLRSEIGGDEYFDVQATIPRFSPISERDARDRDYAASIPLPEVEPDELASSKRSTTEYSHNNLAETKTSNSKKLRRDVEISESPDSGSPKGVALDVTRDDPEEKKDSQSRKSQRESRRHDLDETDVQSNAPFAPEPDEFEKIRKHKRKSKRGSVPDDSLEMDSRSVTASVPGADDFQETRKAKRKSKRESVGYDDAVSAVSAPAAFVDDKESRSKNKKDKKGGLFGLFSSNKSYEDVPEAGKARHAAVETTFDDFEEPKKKSKRKSKDRSSSGDVYDLYGGAAQSVGDLSQIGRSREESDERRSEKTREKEDKRRSRKGSTVEPGITTQDLPSKVYIPASPGSLQCF